MPHVPTTSTLLDILHWRQNFAEFSQSKTFLQSNSRSRQHRLRYTTRFQTRPKTNL